MSNLYTSFKVVSDKVKYQDDSIISEYTYEGSPKVKVSKDGSLLVEPVSVPYQFRTKRKVARTGMLMVGWGGNNGSTVTGAILANRLGLRWRKRSVEYSSNYFGSLTQASTIRIGSNDGQDVYIPFSSILPMVHPNDLVIGGWDINSANLAEAMRRADVFDYDLQRQLEPHMAKFVPMPSVYEPDFIAANQEERANNVIKGTKQQALNRLRQDIHNFKVTHNLDKIIVLWTANTERFADIIPGVNDSADALLSSIRDNHPEIAPSTIFAVASILEHAIFINGSPQNTFVPGCMQLAEREGVHIAGDDFKSGQTKMKSVLVDFLVSAGIKPLAITSYNHLGNNDGKNLSAPKQFRSKEISKSNVVDDMVDSNQILYQHDEHPDHTVVIKYVPTVGDSKRAMDEYVSEIFMGGTNTIALHNTCEDSLLAAPIILDLVILAELVDRISFKTGDMTGFSPFHSVLSILSFLLKAPLVPDGTPVVNALFRQRACLENIFRACVGLSPENHMLLEHKAILAAKQQRDTSPLVFH
eukprot:TRINITY_DN1855_c0_g2_i1.p1 TRINITY_DN1855_c0_g2~~TRINITY_DN1855_c0_g2_i1.p1  ORF type:complete len:528 (-),score=64.93 TRINITY_DN1855_c0_g2_i1:61-1644(-)